MITIQRIPRARRLQTYLPGSNSSLPRHLCPDPSRCLTHESGPAPEQARAQFDAALERLRYAFDAWTSAKHRQFEVILAPGLVLYL